MATFSDARANARNIEVAAANAPGVQDESTANAIRAFGQIAGDARRGQLKADLQTDLEESALIVDSLNAPEAVVTEDGVDISQADPDGVIDTTTEKFQRLSLARQSGVLDVNQAAIEAETLLRQSIARAPGFEPEFRKIASDAVGFDVTGSATRTLFGNPRGSASGQTLLEKMKEQANFLAGQLNLDPTKTLQLLARQQLQEVEDSVMDSNLARNKVSAEQWGGQAAANFETEALGIIVNNLGDDGKIADADGVKALIAASHSRFRSRAANNTINSDGFINLAGRESINSILDPSLESALAIVDNSDLITAMSKRRGALVDAIAIEATRQFPNIVAISEVGGERWLDSYLTKVELAQGNPDVIDDFKKKFPAFDVQTEIVAGLSKETFGDIFKRILTGTVSDLDQTGKENAAAVATLETEDALGNGDGERASKSIDAQTDSGQVKMPLSQVGRRPSRFSTLEESTKANLVAQFGNEQAVQMINIINELQGSGFRVVYNEQTKRLEYTGTDGLDFTDQLTAGGVLRGPGGADNLTFVNEVLLGLQKNGEFKERAGIVDTDAWGTTFAATVNEALEPQPFSLSEAVNTSQEMIQMEPGVYQDADGNIFQVGDDGEFNQIGGRVDRGDLDTGRIDAPRDPDLNPNRSPQIEQLIRDTAISFGLPENLMLALVEQESRFDPNAIGPETRFGRAKGLMQLMPITETEMGVENVFDPTENVEAGTEYLARMLDMFDGNVDHALAAYNWGPGNVRKALRRGDDVLVVAPSETRQYVSKIKRNAGVE